MIPRRAAELLATDSAGFGGIVLRGGSPESFACWLDMLRALLPPAARVTRVPPAISDDRLLGGLDLAATLATGVPVSERGLLAHADGGVVVLPTADRAPRPLIAHLCAALDSGELPARYDPSCATWPARFAVVAHAESDGEDDVFAPSLGDRLAFVVDLPVRAAPAAITPSSSAPADVYGHGETGVVRLSGGVGAGRALADAVEIRADAVTALTHLASRLGLTSVRPVLFAVRAARAHAALAGRVAVDDDDLAMAARLVLAPRATALLPPAPQAPSEPQESSDASERTSQPPEASPADAPETTLPDEDEDRHALEQQLLHDVLLPAARATLPAALLATQGKREVRRGPSQAGKTDATRLNATRGRQVGTMRGDPRGGARLDVLETLRAAAPWRRVRSRARDTGVERAPLVEVRRDDFRLRRMRQRQGVTTVFVVDASGSSALHRLGEAKGAVELLLAESYARRDRVSLIAFRGKGAELLLPPTRAIARARRALAALPGGGGTPLAAAIDAAAEAVRSSARAGTSTTVVFLTDARANVRRDGAGDRPGAQEESRTAARSLSTLGAAIVFIDTSLRPSPFAASLAESMGARYVALPFADAGAISGVARAARRPEASRR